MKKIGRRWYIITILCTIVALVVMVAYNYQMFYSNSVENMQAIGSSNLAQVAEELDGYLTRGMEAVQSTAVSVEYMMEQGATSADIEKFLVYESERYKEEIDENFTGIYGLFAGEYIDGIGWVPDADYDPKTREWYKKALEMGGEPTLVSPYLDAQTGTIMISVSELFRDGESVISLDIVMDRIQKITEGISINKGEGYGFVVDGNGLVVAHNNQQEKGKNYLQTDSEMKRLLEKVYAKDKNVFQMTLDGEEYTVFSDVVMEEWNVVMLVSNDKLFADSRTTLQRNIVICSLIAFVIILFLGITFARMNRSIQMEAQSNAKIEDMNQKVIRALVRTIDAKDRYTNGHSLRVAEYSREIAKRMNKSEKEQDNIYYAGLLHDIGKIRVPEEVINKPGKLTDEEYDQIKIHPVTSYHILKDIYEDKQISMGAKFHHERYDGNGYPNGLKGENIPEIARIIGVADTYDAMASNRSYRKALPQDVVRSEIEKGKGSQFDPEIADVMLSIIDEDKDYKLKETNANVKTVLVVDDEAMNIKMVEIIMKNEPRRRIIGAQSGKEALEILEREEVNLILLDVTMPEMDGFETLERIREKYQIPVVFMTGDKNIETLERAAVYGVDDYLTKPFLPLALKEIIHAIAW